MTALAPDYVSAQVTLYCGDCLEVLPSLNRVVTVITDPVWPNCPEGLLLGSDGTQQALLHRALLAVETFVIVVILGFNSDPRFLTAVPAGYRFIRSQQMPYAVPGYHGRLLGGDEMAYVFGQIPRGNGLIPGRLKTEALSKSSRANGHPCPRSETHMIALLRWWTSETDTVCDPFMGSGTTGVACLRSNRKFIGIEKDPAHFAAALERIKREEAQGRLPFDLHETKYKDET